MRRVVELHWRALLAGSACAGLAACELRRRRRSCSSWRPVVALAAVAVLCGGARRRRGRSRCSSSQVCGGEGSGSTRSSESVLAAEIGESAPAELVVTGRGRTYDRWAVRSAGRACGGSRERHLRERVLARRSPRAARRRAGPVLEAGRPRHGAARRPTKGSTSVRGSHARGSTSSFGRAPGTQIGRRGGIAGLGDRIRDRVERAVGRGTVGVRRGARPRRRPRGGRGASRACSERLPGLWARTTSSPSRARTSPSSQSGSSGSAGCCGSRARRASSRRWRGSAATCSPSGWQPSVIRAGVAGALVLAGVARRTTARSLALPRARRARAPRVGSDLGARARVPALVRGGRGDLRRSSACRVSCLEGYPIPTRLAEGARPRSRLRRRHRSDRARPVRPGSRLHGSGERPCRAGCPVRARARPPCGPRRPRRSGRSGRTRLARRDGQQPGSGSSRGSSRRSRERRSGLERRSCLRCSWQPGGLPARSSRVRLGARGRRPLRSQQARSSARGRGPAGRCVRLRLGTQPAGLRVTFLDVGQGDSVLLETPSARVLVDEGPPEAHVADQLARMGVRSLSAIVLTHPERDHVGGAADVLRRLHVGRRARSVSRGDGARTRGGGRGRARARRAGAADPRRHGVPGRAGSSSGCSGRRTPGFPVRIRT